jgi:prepilin signal peptidase PulO-like enzyme (type II secretory pathway)
MLLIAIALFLLGAVLGSFVCCQAWRIKNRDNSKRSHCQSCSYQLRWSDNLPIISWVALRGKCRKCHRPIGIWEPLSELFLGLAFAATFIFWPVSIGLATWFGIAQFIVFLALLTGMALLFIYDARWGELPMRPLTFCTACAIIYLILQQWSLFAVAGFSSESLLNLLGALFVLPVFYFFLYKISNEQWVGSGDWILCIPLALVLGNFWLAFFCLFAANFLGSLASIPTLLKRKKQHKIHFGPFLILGFLIVFLAQDLILSLFMLG